MTFDSNFTTGCLISLTEAIKYIPYTTFDSQKNVFCFDLI